jgi:dTDP-4-amino-4,6-dideoxygalactose transaminase
MPIKLTKPYITGRELSYIKDIVDNGLTSSGDGKYTKLVHKLLEERYGTQKALLTTSCTSALEFAIRLSNLKPGDEVIVPSFTFSSTVNAILLSNGIKVKFADIDEKTLNIDPEDIKKKLTKKTKAIMVVHYAGVACDMDAIMDIANERNIIVIEDAAQAIESKYKGKYLGTIGHFGCLSFHDTKNISCGEGGALLINTTDKKILERAEIIREKGTNRTKFLLGEVDKYTWVDVGSSYLPSDILAAYLYAQLEDAEKITTLRKRVWNMYFASLKKYVKQGLLSLPFIPEYAEHNGHIFYVLLSTHKARNYVMDYMKKLGVQAPFHYIPLHSSPMGVTLGYTKKDLPMTEKQSGRLIRLPLYPTMTDYDIRIVLESLRGALNTMNDLASVKQTVTTAKVVKAKLPKKALSKKTTKTAIKKKVVLRRATK